MPWNSELLAAANQGLRNAAAQGSFVPSHWVDETDPSDGNGGGFHGCGWGVVAWSVAVAHGGIDYAIKSLPVGCSQTQINLVLKDAGLTRAEIISMDPQETWAHFDNIITEGYADRAEYPGSFQDVSCEAALYFIEVLKRVPVAPTATAKVLSLPTCTGHASEASELTALAA